MESYTDSILTSSQDSYTKMWEWMNDTLCAFRKCYSREAAFRWFVVVVVGFIVRTDSLGVSAFNRGLFIDPRYYATLLHFFRSDSWNLKNVRNEWIQIMKNADVLFRESSMPILVGDGVKQSKEAKRMPCVKRLFQESENSSKATYIFGHMFGAIGVLIGNAEKLSCVPLSMTIQDGDERISQWMESNAAEESHVVRIIRGACTIASILSHSILLLDRYFLSVPALQAWIEEEKRVGCRLLTIITKAKSNAIAYEKPIPKAGRGRPAKKGRSLKLSELFMNNESAFTQAVVMMYGKAESVSYLCKDLLWGQKLYHELRFVLVKYGSTQSILVCTDLSMPPEQIIRLYSYRFKIESCFREFKQVIAGFSYHFWSKVMPNLNRFAKSGSDRLDNVTKDEDKERILSTFMAIEKFVMTACIAMGLTQICAIRFFDVINLSSLRWLRTQSNKMPSEATTAHFMRISIFRMFHFHHDLTVMPLIRSVQSQPSEHADSLAALSL